MLYFAPKTTLKRGCAQNEVRKLQRLLSQKQCPIAMTGSFDYDTEIAVKAFQSRMFLKPDGIVGPLTWEALYSETPVGMPTLTQGCHSSEVEAVQEILAIDLYYVGETDGVFGPETHRAVQRLQSEYGLPDDGVVNAATWRILAEI